MLHTKRIGYLSAWANIWQSRWSITLLLVVLCCTCVRAQDHPPRKTPSPPDTVVYEYPVRTITVREGLSRNQIYRVWEDHRGFIWLAGKRGIDRFDGLEVLSFKSDTTINSGTVIRITEDTEGTVWFLSKDAIYWYDGQRFSKTVIRLQDKVTSVSLINNTPILHSNSETGSPIFRIAPGFELPEGKNQIVIPKFPGKRSDGIPDSCFYYIKFGDANNPDTLRVLTSFQSGEIKDIRYDKSIKLVKPTIPGQPIQTIIKDSLFSLNKGKLTFQRLISTEVFAHGSFWAYPGGTIHKQIQVVYLPEVRQAQLFRSKDATSSVHYRKNRVLIAGEEGLSIVRPESAVMIYPTSRGMASDVWSILEEGEDAGAKNGEAAKFFIPFTEQTIIKLKGGQYTKISGLRSDDAIYLYPGASRRQNGTFLIPTDDRIFSFNPATEQFIDLDGKKRRATNDIHEVGNRIYAASKGLVIYENDKFQHLNGDPDGLDMKNLDFLESITPDRDGRLWLGSHLGLAVRAPDGTFKNYIAEVDIPAGIVHGAVDQRGDLWFATHDGIAYCDYTDSLPRWVTPDFHVDVKFVHPIDSTWLLIGGTDKLYLLDLPKFYAGTIDIYPYDEDDGFPVAEPLQASVYEDSEGIIWIGTTESVVSLDPSKIVVHKTPTKPHYHSISYLDETATQETSIVIPFNSNGDQSFTIKSTDQNIDIRFFTINHDKPHSMKFRYRLVGYRDSWSRPEPARYVNFGELPPGNYRFEIQACLLGNCTETKSLELRVVPARFSEYPLTRYGAGSLLLLIFGALGYQIYVKRRERRFAEQQRLSFAMERVQTRRKLTVHKIGPHFANNALTAINDLIIRKENDSARRYTSRFARLFRPVLEDSLSLLRPLAEELDFIEDYLELELLRFEQKLKYVIKVDPEIERNAYEILVPTLLIQSFVNNAVKHGIEPLETGGLLTVTITKSDTDYLLVTISDNGPGFRDGQADSGTGIKSARVILDYLNQYTETNSTIEFPTSTSKSFSTVVCLRLFLHHEPID